MGFLFHILVFILSSAFTHASLYPGSYQESREYFIELGLQLKNTYPQVEQKSLMVDTRTSETLTIDTLYIPQKGLFKERLVIITGGIHGIEAYTGSALQFEFIKNLDQQLLAKTGFLFVHAVNPYGYHFNRRVSEDNIDLNRNFSATEKQFKSQSPAYENFDRFLNPTEPISASHWHDFKLFLKSLYKLAQYGKKQLTQIVVGGQYQNSKGIYFGGNATAHNAKLIGEEFLRVAGPYQKVLHIDLHTGYGKRGELHFFSDQQTAKIPGFEDLFKGFKIDYGQDKDFYETSGSFDRFTIDTLADKQVIPMTFEFGTLDSQTILGGFYSLRNMIYENQGHHYGYEDRKSEERVKALFSDMFNPKDKAWRDNVLETGLNTFKTVTGRFAEIEL